MLKTAGIFGIIGSALLCALPFSCAIGNRESLESKAMFRPIEQVQQDSSRVWMELTGVVGCGITESRGKSCIVVMVNKKTPVLLKRIGAIAEGYDVIVEETGPVKALEKK
jgi:hypothetical protein